MNCSFVPRKLPKTLEIQINSSRKATALFGFFTFIRRDQQQRTTGASMGSDATPDQPAGQHDHCHSGEQSPLFLRFFQKSLPT